MPLIPLPAFADNYFWLLHAGDRALVVDPGDAQVVLHWLAQHPGTRLEAILVTHHHADHTGGLAALVQATGAKVWGPARETLPIAVQTVADGDRVQALGCSWQVLEVPGHTAGHVAYWAEPQDQAPVLFCGDTLFSAGCGRLFEGTPAQMLASLDRLSQLPDQTRVCCAHEYTLANLRFAQAVLPTDADIAQHFLDCQRLRQDGHATLPSTLALERRINPFLRSREPAVRAQLRAQGWPTPDHDAQAFAQLRQWKNQFT